MQQALARAYKNNELAVIAALRTVYFMAKKNLPNDHFSDLKQFLVVQGCTSIGNLSFQCGHSGRQITYEHSESVRGFQEAIGAVVEQRADFESNKGQLMDKLIDNLKSRFPESESGVFSSFSVLDPQVLHNIVAAHCMGIALTL